MKASSWAPPLGAVPEEERGTERGQGPTMACLEPSAHWPAHRMGPAAGSEGRPRRSHPSAVLVDTRHLQSPGPCEALCGTRTGLAPGLPVPLSVMAS